MKAIVNSNQTRKEVISKYILRNKSKTIGFFRIVMKKDSDNYRSSSVVDIIESVKAHTSDIVIYEPTLLNDFQSFKGCKIVHSINEFKKISDIIITNRFSSELDDVSHKVFTRDIFQEN